MSSSAKLSKKIVIVETWKGMSEVQSNWGEIYILKTKYHSINNRNIFLEDYEKINKIEDKLDSFLEMLCKKFYHRDFMLLNKYIMKMKREIKKMEKLLKDCDLFEVDDFYAINYFLHNKVMLKYQYKRILNVLEEFRYFYEEIDYINNLYEIFKKEIWPIIIKIKDKLHRRAIYKM